MYKKIIRNRITEKLIFLIFATLIISSASKKTDNIIVADPIIDCDSPYSYNNVSNQCEYIDSLLPISTCSIQEVSHGTHCIKRTVLLPQLKCPDDFDYIDNLCKKSIYTPLVMQCPDNSTSSDYGCLQEITVIPEESCINGELKDHQCITYEIAQDNNKCPSGYTESGNICVKNTFTKIDYSCRTNEKLENNKCTAISKIAYNLTCEKDFYLVNGKCYSKRVVEPNLICPSNFTYSNGECFQTIETTPISACPNDTLEIGDKCVTGSDIRVEGIDYNIILNEISSIPAYKYLRNKVLTCPNNSTLVQDSCQSIQIVEPQKECDVGFYEGNIDLCVIESFNRPTYVCPDDYTPDLIDNKSCVKTVVTEPEKTCREGILDLKNDRCMITEVFKRNIYNNMSVSVPINISEPTKNCPNGMILKDDLCLGVLIFEPEFICSAELTKTDGKCHKDIEIQPEYYCEKGFLLNDQCIIEEEISVEKSCPKGYTLNADLNSCTKTFYTNYYITCPDGMYFDQIVNQCYSVINDQNQIQTEDLLDLEVKDAVNQKDDHKLNPDIKQNTTAAVENKSISVEKTNKSNENMISTNNEICSNATSNQNVTITKSENLFNDENYVNLGKYVGKDAIDKIFQLLSNK